MQCTSRIRFWPVSATRARGIVAGRAKRPVISAAREAAQNGAVTYPLVNRAPLAASASMCGVGMSFPP